MLVNMYECCINVFSYYNIIMCQCILMYVYDYLILFQEVLSFRSSTSDLGRKHLKNLGDYFSMLIIQCF